MILMNKEQQELYNYFCNMIRSTDDYKRAVINEGMQLVEYNTRRLANELLQKAIQNNFNEVYKRFMNNGMISNKE